MKQKYKWLFYVDQYSMHEQNYKTFIFGSNDKDPFHTVGEIYYQATTEIKSLRFIKCTQDKINYWNNRGMRIYSWTNIYNKKGKLK